MKSIRNQYCKICDFKNLLSAHNKSRKGKRNKASVMSFETEMHYNIWKLKSELENKTYKIGGYNEFKVFEPKERDVMSLGYRDRVVQHALCDNVLEPFLEKRLDYDNAACRKGKGTHFALNRLKGHMKKAYNLWGCDYYVLKCDIRKYFYNIDHFILKKNLYKYIEDTDIKWLLDIIIDSTDGGVGLPIGNMTSQWFAIFYLDAMDRYIRSDLGIKFYSRYMDDFVLLHKDKGYLKQCLNNLRVFLAEELHLELNEKTQIFPIKNGVDYVGFHSYLTETGKVIRKLRKRSKQKIKRKIHHFNRAYAMGEIDFETVRCSTASWLGHAKHGNTYYLRKNIMKRLKLQRASGGTPDIRTKEEGL